MPYGEGIDEFNLRNQHALDDVVQGESVECVAAYALRDDEVVKLFFNDEFPNAALYLFSVK